jgi:predicted AAA+ superfamily ATPase
MIETIVQNHKKELEKQLAELYHIRFTGQHEIDNNLIKVILGPRRSGKSIYGMHLVKSLGKFGYLNFDDERLLAIKDIDKVLAAVDRVYDNPKILLLDEIQNIDNWEIIVNRLQRERRNLFITGSNAHLLSSELATHLTGRHLPIIIFPFSFSEYKSVVRDGEVQKYLEVGGYPEPLLNKINRETYLTQLFESLLYKNIVKRHKIRSSEGLEDLAYYLLSNIGSEYSGKRLAQITRCKSATTVEKFIGFMEEAFLFFTLRSFSFKVSEQVKKNRKIYCIDNGFITAKAFQHSVGIGKLAENCVAALLHKKELEGYHKIYFWKNTQHQEVDFVVFKNRKVEQLIQVAWNINDPKTRERETRVLVKAAEELKCNDLVILTESRDDEEAIEWFGFKGQVKYKPLSKWMAEQTE